MKIAVPALLLLGLAIASPVRAAPADDRRARTALKTAESELAELKFEAARDRLEAAVRASGFARVKPSLAAAVLVRLGRVRAELGDLPGAEAAFGRATTLDRAVRAPAGVSPKIRQMLESARSKARAAAPPPPPPKPPRPARRKRRPPERTSPPPKRAPPSVEQPAPKRMAPEPERPEPAPMELPDPLSAETPARPEPEPTEPAPTRTRRADPPPLSEAWADPTPTPPPPMPMPVETTETSTGPAEQPWTTWGPGLNEAEVIGLSAAAVAVAAAIVVVIVATSGGDGCDAPEGFGCTEVRVLPLSRF